MPRFLLLLALLLSLPGVGAETPLARFRHWRCRAFLVAAGYEAKWEAEDAEIEALIAKRDREAKGELWKRIVPLTNYQIDEHTKLDLLQETYLKFAAQLDRHPERFVNAAYARNLARRILHTQVLTYIRSRWAVRTAEGNSSLTTAAHRYLLLYRDFGIDDDRAAGLRAPGGDPNFFLPAELDAYRAYLAEVEVAVWLLLTDEEKQVVDLRFKDGLSQREIAKRLEKHEGTISRVLNRAFEKITEALLPQ